MVAVVLEVVAWWPSAWLHCSEMAAADAVATARAVRASPRGRTLVVVPVASRRPPLRTRPAMADPDPGNGS